MTPPPPAAGGTVASLDQRRQPEPPPAWPIDTWGTNVCAYSTGSDNDGRERGVYIQRGQRWTKIGPLPFVLEVIEHLDGAGRQVSPSFRLSPTPLADPARVTLVSDEDLGKGLWAGPLGLAVACDPKITQTIGSAVRQYARTHRVPVSRSVPSWTGEGELLLPAADVGPAGYGQLAPIAEDTARAAWSRIVAEAAEAPKLGLIAGLSLGGLFVRPLGRSSCVALLVGSAGKGKSTALVAGAAALGDPSTGNVVRTWNSTPIGLTQELGLLSSLPAFRDEYGSAGLDARKTEQMILAVAEGASRTTGGKTGTPRTSPTWFSVLIANGNDSILGEVTNEAVARRLIEVETPITRDAASAELVEDLAREHYGWPLHWLRAAGVTPAEFGERLAAAQEDIGAPAESVPRSLGKHLALGVAGAELLDHLVHGDAAGPLRTAVLEIARQLLDQLVSEARERGITPGERVLSAVVDALVSRPGNFPDRGSYRSAVAGGPGPALREVEGWDLSADTALDGDVAVLSSRLAGICAEAGITNPGTGLRELTRSGADGRPGLLRSSDPEGRRVQRINVGDASHRPSVYVFRLGELLPTEPPAAPVDPGPAFPDPVPGSPVRSQSVPGSATETGNRRVEPVTSDDNASKDTLVPGVPGFSANHRMREESHHSASPSACSVCADPGVMWCGFGQVSETPAPCLVCGEPTAGRAACGAVRHAGCRVDTAPTTVAEAPNGETRTEPAARPAGRRLRPTDSGVDAAREVDPAEELDRFSRVVRSRYPDAGAEDLAAGLALFTEATSGLRFVSFPGEVGIAAYARLVARHAAMPVPEPLGENTLSEHGIRIRLSVDYLNRKLKLPAGGHRIVGCDVNAQYLAAAHSGLILGDGEPVTGSPNPLAVITSSKPGYVRMGRAVSTRRLGLGRDGSGKLARGEWITTPTAKYLIKDRGIELPIDEIVWWRDSGRRLDKWAKPLARAYRTLKPREDAPARFALVAVKSVYTAFLGGMLRSKRYNRTGLWRPDWADQLRTLAWANQWRALDKAESAGAKVLGVYRDAAWFVVPAGHPAGEPYSPPELTIDPSWPGKWKLDRAAELDEDMRAALTDGSVPRFAAALADASGVGTGPDLLESLAELGLGADDPDDDSGDAQIGPEEAQS